MEMCSGLAEFNILLTLVHGDLTLSNTTYDPLEGREVLLFDWEFACIGHPLCDLIGCTRIARKT